MLDQNVLHSRETEIRGMGEVRIRIGTTENWDDAGLMFEIQWKDANGNWTHGRSSVEFSMNALGEIHETLVEFAEKVVATEPA